MLEETFGYNAVALMKTYGWFKHFKNGQISVDGEERSGQSDQNHGRKCGKVREAVREDGRCTTHGVGNIVGLSYGTC